MKENLKCLLVFGATSDEKTYAELERLLRQGSFAVDLRIISAHRNPLQLAQALQEDNYDVVLAGAGLSAHLPGVAASQTTRPVIGIPVNAAFGGLDAFCSISQMPFGVPVLTVWPGPLPLARLLGFLRHWQERRERALAPRLIQLVLPRGEVPQDVLPELEKQRRSLQELAQFCNWDLQLGEATVVDPSVPSIVLARDQRDLTADKDRFAIHVPLLSPAEMNRPETMLSLLNMAKDGGLWVGANNAKNALLFLLQMFEQGREGSVGEGEQLFLGKLQQIKDKKVKFGS